MDSSGADRSPYGQRSAKELWGRARESLTQVLNPVRIQEPQTPSQKNGPTRARAHAHIPPSRCTITSTHAYTHTDVDTRARTLPRARKHTCHATGNFRRFLAPRLPHPST